MFFNRNKQNKEKKGLFYQVSGMKHIQSAFGVTKDMLKGLGTKRANEYHTETVEGALERFNIPKNEWATHLMKRYKGLQISFSVLGIALLVFFIFGIIGNFVHGNIMGGILYLAIGFAVFTNILNNAFRCYQIRRYFEKGINDLGGLDIFLKSPKEWFPRKIKTIK